MRVTLKPIVQQTIVITGAASGIGLATAKAAALKGARVILADSDAEALHAAEDAIRAEGGEAMQVVTDIARREEIEALTEKAIAAYGGFDSWVNNAGHGSGGRLEDMNEDETRRLFEAQFWGVVNGSLVAARHLKSSGGAIINLGSAAFEAGLPSQGIFSAGQHAVKGFTNSLRMELKAEGAPVCVTLIQPAPMDTPEDVAPLILYAAEHGARPAYERSGAKMMASLNQSVPALFDWLETAILTRRRAPEAPGHEPDPEATGEANGEANGHGNGQAPRDPRPGLYDKAVQHPVISLAAMTLVGVGGAAALLAEARRQLRRS